MLGCIRTHPSLRAEYCFLPARRPLGFAPPLRSGFALLAIAHTDALGCRHIPNACYDCNIHRIPELRNTPWRKLSTERWCYVLTCPTSGFAQKANHPHEDKSVSEKADLYLIKTCKSRGSL